MKIKNVMMAGAMMLVSAFAITAPTSAVTCPSGSVNGTANTLAECNIKSDNSLMPTVQTIISVIIGVLGLAAVLVIVLGGVQYTTSSGDPTKVKKAKDTILYGIIGLVVAILAYAIVNFVLAYALGGTASAPAPTSTATTTP